MADGLNQARALRVAEIINDYRTLLVHISQQNVQVPGAEINEDGYRVIRECLAASQTLMSSNYSAAIPPAHGNNEETEKAELRRVIVDASARRFRAHKIYLRVAAAKRWAINRQNVLRGSPPGPQHASQLQTISATLRQELSQLTDQYVVSDLRAADVRARHWLDDDPSLPTILGWIRSHP
ncbi:hypothetical protein FE257_005043 [Aspergillus nanangensis]|uniref:Uncharacterized protein n=1 Tax=Aspergillus nanangensis TaxID=2582783 RepID=A0AAD4CSV5_ASPNN|nr:hypothetical protein FE257_005043 [Aspergillus nanangensis]